MNSKPGNIMILDNGWNDNREFVLEYDHYLGRLLEYYWNTIVWMNLASSPSTPIMVIQGEHDTLITFLFGI